MKRLSTSLLAPLLALSVSGTLAAAEPESSFGLAPTAAPKIEPGTPSAVLPLIPDPVAPADKPKAAAGLPSGDKTSMAEDRLRRRIQLRMAQSKAEREPDLQAIKDKAMAARTDFEQRAIFFQYYTAFCDRLYKFDKTLNKVDVDDLRKSYTSRFVQNRIQPTVDPATFHTAHN